MIKYKCKTCGGEYENVMQDGLQYYHACPQILDKDGIYIERPNKRDENAGIKLEGLGRETSVSIDVAITPKEEIIQPPADNTPIE